MFSDVEDGRFYTDPVERAADNGITFGRSETQFVPDGSVTRGESVTFLKRYHDNIASALNTDTLADLTCGATQVAIDDGGWRCADPVLQQALSSVATQTLADTNNVGAYTSIAIGNDGNPVISYLDVTNIDLEVAKVDAITGIAFGVGHRLAVM